MYRFLILVLFASLFASAQERGSGVNFYSKEKESALGMQVAAEVRRQMAVIESDIVNQYVERMGSKLAAVLPDRGITYTFTVVQNNIGGSTNEPLALPGGYIFIPANLFLAARNEAEFGGMLAHAIAHVAARHGTRQATRAQITELSPLPFVFLSSPTAGDGSLLPGGLLSLQRSFETEADRLAVAITTKAGYDPEALARYVARLQYDTTGKLSSSLPPRDERIAAIRTAIQQLPQNEFPHIQDELHKLLPLPNPPSLLK
jgi:predicted Zn-dependent protease